MTMLTPRDEPDVADALRDATGPVQVVGGNTRPIMPVRGTQMSVNALAGVRLYDPGALTLVAGAGTPVADIAALLATENQQLAFEPADYRAILGTQGIPTIGGVLASNTSGPRRVQAGAARDFALGVRFVDGTGAVIKNGGRVMKNVTGYDLVKLMAGSWGRLGALTEVAFKVLPKPETTASISVETPNPTHGVAALSAALASPFDVTGAAWVDGVAHIRLEGFDASVAYRTTALRDRLAQFGMVALHDDPATLWDGIRDLTPLQGHAGDLWRITVKPTDGPRVLAQLPGRGYLDWGGGLVWALVPTGFDLRSAMAGAQGDATLFRGTGCGPIFHPQTPTIARITQGIYDKFDPKGIFQPERIK